MVKLSCGVTSNTAHPCASYKMSAGRDGWRDIMARLEEIKRVATPPSFLIDRLCAVHVAATGG